MTDSIRVAIGQIAPDWLQRATTLTKVMAAVSEAADQGAQLIGFGEALVPGYPFWLDRTGGAAFDDARQKRWHAHYLKQAVCIEQGHLDPLCQLVKQRRVAVWLGIIERPTDRGGHTVYCTLVHIDPQGQIRSRHRKLVPTYEERLAWGAGDGHGLVVNHVDEVAVTALNCWENWMPLARAALYAQGPQLHIASWPGSRRNTDLITPFIAREGRCFVMSVSSLMRAEDAGDQVPDLAAMRLAPDTVLADGGSCICAPNGDFLVAPLDCTEQVVSADLDLSQVRAEHQNFDCVGHYSRPDVLSLSVNRQRQSTVDLKD